MKRGKKLLRLLRSRTTTLCLLSLLLIFLPGYLLESPRLTIIYIVTPFVKLSNRIKDLFTVTKIDPKIEAENDYLKRKIIDILGENKRLKLSMNWQETLPEKREFITADVIVSTDSSKFRDSLVVAKGSKDGLKQGMICIFGNYLVGKIDQIGPFSSRVMLTSDPAFKVGATCPAINQTGIAEGASRGGIYLKWITDQDVKDQLVLTTSDPLKNIPKGLIIGKVKKVERSRHGFLSISVERIINPQNLEYIAVLKDVD